MTYCVLKKHPLILVQAEKRRESIMVGLNKTRDQLSASEDRIKQLQLEVQRTQMDLLAKTGNHQQLPNHILPALLQQALGCASQQKLNDKGLLTCLISSLHRSTYA